MISMVCNIDDFSSIHSQLLYFASKLPWREKIIMKDIIIRMNEDLNIENIENNENDSNQLKIFWILLQNNNDIKLFKENVLKFIVERTIRYSHNIWDHIFEDISPDVGKKISKNGRELNNLRNDPNFTYGEINFYSFATLLEKVDPQNGDIFCDLGHGTGRAVIAAALLHGEKFSKCYGIELVTSLYNASTEMVQRYEYIRENDPLHHKMDTTEIYVQNGDILAESNDNLDDWTDANIIFINSTCFGEELWDNVSKKAENVKKGTKIISLTKNIRSNNFQLLSRKQYKMSWGPASVYIQIKI